MNRRSPTINVLGIAGLFEEAEVITLIAILNDVQRRAVA